MVLLWEKVWFPGIDNMTKAAIKRCVPCQAAISQTTYEPLKMTPLPEALWCELSTDFYGPLPSGEYLVVIVINLLTGFKRVSINQMVTLNQMRNFGKCSPCVPSPLKGALYRIWCGVNILGDSGVKVVWIVSAILQLLLSRRVSYC